MFKIPLILYSILLSMIFSVEGSAKIVGEARISGQILNYPKSTLQLILEEDLNRKKSKIIAEILTDEQGKFKIEKSLVPHIYTLKLSDGKSVMLAVDAGQNIVITGDATSKSPLQVTGSEDTRKLENYETFRKASLNRLVTSVRNQIREVNRKGVPQNDPKLLELARTEVENYEQHKNELIAYIKNEMGTSLAIYPTSIRWSGDKNIAFFVELAKQFEEAHPSTEIASLVTEKVNIIVANSIGGKVADIKMPDKNGKIIALNSIKAKYILIDFWASWCIPCRAESPLLNELYQNYKGKGFEIYGVALEPSKEAWLNAIEKDKRTWINVSNFQQFESSVAFQYAVTSLPSNVLIDSEGKVMARNLHGDELKAMIDKLFLMN